MGPTVAIINSLDNDVPWEPETNMPHMAMGYVNTRL